MTAPPARTDAELSSVVVGILADGCFEAHEDYVAFHGIEKLRALFAEARQAGRAELEARVRELEGALKSTAARVAGIARRDADPLRSALLMAVADEVRAAAKGQGT